MTAIFGAVILMFFGVGFWKFHALAFLFFFVPARLKLQDDARMTKNAEEREEERDPER